MKITHLVFASLIAFVLVSCGGKVKENPKYNYISAEETAELMRKDASKLVLVDIQEKPDFEEEHLKGALATYAYPVKTEDEKALLSALLPTTTLEQKVFTICPRGGEGADRAYDFYLEKGVKKEQLFTLKGGQYEWPRDKIKDVLAK